MVTVNKVMGVVIKAHIRHHGMRTFRCTAGGECKMETTGGEIGMANSGRVNVQTLEGTIRIVVNNEREFWDG